MAGFGFEVERITEPALRFSKAPDFVLRRQRNAVAVCEVKSIGEFDYTVKVNHKDGPATETLNTTGANQTGSVCFIGLRGRSGN